jgi:hypothetical protein
MERLAESPEQWFEEYDGPKDLLWQDGQFQCWIGLNAMSEGGTVRGYEVAETGDTAASAILKAMKKYEEYQLADSYVRGASRSDDAD